jgi:hypothetical protein
MPVLCFGQYKPWQLPKGVVLPGERFLEMIVPTYSIRDRPLTEAMKDLAHAFGLRLQIEIVASHEFRDPLVSVDVQQSTLKDIVNRIIKTSGFAEAEWRVDSSEADVFHIVLGRVPEDYPLSTRVATWSSPAGESPEDVLINLIWDIPVLRQRFYGSSGVIASHGPVVFGCVLQYRAENLSVREIVWQISRIGHKSWMFIYVKGNEKKTRMLVF